MSSGSLREQLYRTPFQPVTLFLPSGRSVTVSNPEFAMFNGSGRLKARSVEGSAFCG